MNIEDVVDIDWACQVESEDDGGELYEGTLVASMSDGTYCSIYLDWVRQDHCDAFRSKNQEVRMDAFKDYQKCYGLDGDWTVMKEYNNLIKRI